MVAFRAANNALNLSGKSALVIGATQGIGAAVARRFNELGANVIIAGRNKERGQAVLDSFTNTKPSRRFVPIDTSHMASIRTFAQTITGDTPKLDFLVNSAGKTPNGSIGLTSENVESHFATQCLGKFYTTWLLRDVIGDGTVAWIVAAGGKNKVLDMKDPELLSTPLGFGPMAMAKQGDRDTNYLDAMALEMAKRTQMRTIHLFPGIVNTNVFENAGFHWLLVKVWNLIKPLITSSPESYADVPIWYMTNPGMESKRTILGNEKGKEYPVAEFLKDDEWRAEIFEWSVKRANEAGAAAGA